MQNQKSLKNLNYIAQLEVWAHQFQVNLNINYPSFCTENFENSLISVASLNRDYMKTQDSLV